MDFRLSRQVARLAKVGIAMLKNLGKLFYLLFSKDVSSRKRKSSRLGKADPGNQRPGSSASIASLRESKVENESKIKELRARAVKGDINAHGEWIELIKTSRKKCAK